MEVTRNRSKRTISFSQKGLIDRMVKKFGLENAKGANTPMEISTPKALSMVVEEETVKETIPYQQLTGSLNWISICTRPDISYATSILCSYNKDYKQQHWEAGKRVLRYLKHTASYGLNIGKEIYKDSQVEIQAYSDASYGEDMRTRRSQGGFVFILGGAISWQSKRQKTVAVSTTEAEYMQMLVSHIGNEITYVASQIDRCGAVSSCIARTQQTSSDFSRLVLAPSSSSLLRSSLLRSFVLRSSICLHYPDRPLTLQ